MIIIANLKKSIRVKACRPLVANILRPNLAQTLAFTQHFHLFHNYLMAWGTLKLKYSQILEFLPTMLEEKEKNLTCGKIKYTMRN